MDLDKTRNPNFGELHKFPNIELAAEPLCWPFIEIIVEDKNKEKFLSFSGCEDCFTTISLVDFAPKGILSDFELVYAKEQLQRNQDALVMVQDLVDPKGFLKKIGAFYDATDFQNLVTKND